MLKLCWELLHVMFKAEPLCPAILSWRGSSCGDEDDHDNTFLIRVWKVAKGNFSFLSLKKEDLDFISIALKNNLTLHLPLLDISPCPMYFSTVAQTSTVYLCWTWGELITTYFVFSFLAVFKYYPHVNRLMRSVERYLKLCRGETNMKKLNYISKVTNS